MMEYRPRKPGEHWFESEDEAQSMCVEALRPFCSALVEKPELKSGLIPDIGFRLAALPNIPLVMEVKNLSGDKFAAELASGIVQAAEYADELKTKAFVAPLYGNHYADACWTKTPYGAMGLLGSHINVGLFLTAGVEKQRISILVLAQAAIATLTFTEFGDPHCKVHSAAEHLLKYKARHGSASWRHR